MSAGIRGFAAGLAGGIAAVVLILRGTLTAAVPVVALALWERAVRIMPMEVFGFLIVRLKFAAKPLGFWGIMVGVVVGLGILGAVLQRSPRLRRRPAQAGLAAFVLALAPLAALTLEPAASLLASRLEAAGVTPAMPAITRMVFLALAVYAGAFALLYALLVWALAGMARAARRTHVGEPSREGAPAGARDATGGMPGGAAPATGTDALTRREALRRSLAVAAGLLLGTTAARWLAATGARTVAAAQSLFQRIKGLPPEVTPNKDFYVVSKNPPGFDPTVKADTWRLEVGGLVPKPVKLTYDEIKAMPSVRRYHTLECISNEVGGDLISNAMWRGVRFRDLIDKAGGVSPKAVKIAFRCADGYTESIPVMDALDPDTMLAYEMNGEPLPTAHGFPVRLLVPGLFGMKNPKWITKIEPVDYDFQGYWEKSGWSDEAVVKTMSKFTTPRSRQTVGLPEVEVGGVAYAGDRGISAVEYSTDDGKTWQPAETKEALGKYTWVLWAAIWKPSGPAEYTLKVRAKDGGGVVQTSRQTATLPDGASGYHTLKVRVRK